MLKKAKELFFKFRTRHFKFIECRKSEKVKERDYVRESARLMHAKPVDPRK